MKLRLACAGSLPPKGDATTYPFSHIEHWLERQLKLQYTIVGTGEPGGSRRYGMVERFTQDMEGVEIRLRGGKAKSYCVGKIRLASKPEDAKEIAEVKHLASVTPSGVLKKATITDPVTIGFEFIANNPGLLRTYPDIYEDVTDSLKPIVGTISDYADIVQFDCPFHATRPTKEPWRYVNELTKITGKTTWAHIDGDIGQMLPTLIEKYDVDVLNVNFFGKEEESNSRVIVESGQMLQDAGKKLAPAVVNTQIRDQIEDIESVESIHARISRLSSQLGFDMLEAATPGCGLGLLENTAQTILERLQSAVEKMDVV